ncbi:hypothetical protein [Paenibacillus wynnii]|uniref:Uncharacterized protein n=1 Tax=Paenibacillus wynnii TaxID=268407 RepID=A0A098MA49_9BACL|nr:hypothetical protein [Paenibacillus wynnii]KGE18931.1 hypothetical protein PWYN_05885 [Paenibacillus wynnii]
MLKKVLALLSLLLAIASPAFAAAPSLPGLRPNDATTISLNDETSLLVNKGNATITAINLSTETLSWKKAFTTLYDVKILQYPTKIIILTEEKQHLKKLTLDASGNLLTQTVYVSMKTGMNPYLAYWVAPDEHNNEMILIQQDKNTQLFKSPWNKPFKQLKTAMEPNSSYENVILRKLAFQSPYLIVEQDGGAFMQDQIFYQVFDIYSGKKYTIASEWNVSSEFSIRKNQLIITTSYGELRPSIGPKKEHQIFGVYDLKTGKPITLKTYTFSNDSVFFAWDCTFQNDNTFFFTDLISSSWTLFDSNGTGYFPMQNNPVATLQQFIHYSSKLHKASFLISSDNGKSSFLINQQL